ncbi:hypothetical protein FAF44_36585 [Nonomuraea sp. MG754425]|uniref:hypothetical protein n=1 Tax=Nonomuraea sp. MG754425 TaxID=2570319 RepID=UPI001F3C7C63|nr:hypothetical protein [Nonomuraea sp. MG754425]MCF6473862.1 hypothetical protein [Nonomuraea sp. MG754425]
MDRTQVMVRRLGDGEHVRVGEVLSRERGVFTVRWNDDETEESLRLDYRNLLVTEGTLRFISLVDPKQISKRFTDDPLRLVLQLLSEFPSGLKATDIKSKLMDFGLDGESVDRAWRSVQTKLAKHGDVTTKGGNKTVKMYVYRAKPSDTPPAPLPDDDTSEGAEASQETIAPEAAPEPDEIIPAEEPVEPFSTRLSSLLGFKQARKISDLLAEPLRTGVALGRLDSAAIERFSSQLDESDQRTVSTLLLAVPKKVQAVPLPSEVQHGVLGAAIAELLTEAPAEFRAAAGWLLRRVAASPMLVAEVVGPFVQLSLFLTENPQKSDLEVLDFVAHALSRAVPALDDDVLLPERLALLVQALPFSEEGGRVPLMVAVHERSPGSLLIPRWWDGASTEALVECGQGRFGRVIASAEILELIVRPLMERELTEVTTRTRLGVFLRLPVELAEQLPVSAFVNAFRRVGRHDPIIAAWAEALGGEEQLAATRSELAQARQETETAMTLKHEAELLVQELTERCNRLERQLQETQAGVLRRRASQDRQLQIDVMRALADLAAEVEELSVRSVSPDTMIARVHGLTATYDLRPIGLVHEKSEFDLKLHKPIAGDPEPGDEVIIRRSGYIWSSSTEEVVLHKALVEHPQGMPVKSS